jgi:hypothetical protein
MLLRRRCQTVGCRNGRVLGRYCADCAQHVPDPWRG